jgi:hypothetical protein
VLEHDERSSNRTPDPLAPGKHQYYILIAV